MTVVLDASALLAFLLDEAGQEQVDSALSEALISGVNWSEVVQQLVRRGAELTNCREDLEVLGLTILPFDAQAAEQAAQLWPLGRPYGLSLGDRACIALGIALKAPILTADKVWTKAFPNLDICVIR